MKQFSNSINDRTNKYDNTELLKNKLDLLIDSNISIQVNEENSNDVNLSIDGKDELVIQLEKIITLEKIKEQISILESVKSNPYSLINENFKIEKKVSNMKKFSNLEVSESIKVSKLEKSINTAINNLNIKIIGESFEDKKLNLVGQSDLLSEILKLVEEEKANESFLVKENLKIQSYNHIDQNAINNKLERLLEMYDELVLAPAPTDIFNMEDYDLQGDTIELTSLNSIPEDYLDFLNESEIESYFEDGNKIRIMYSDNGWHLFFVPELSNYANLYKNFIMSNKDFITDFIKATVKLVGSKNLIFDKELLNSL